MNVNGTLILKAEKKGNSIALFTLKGLLRKSMAQSQPASLAEYLEPQQEWEGRKIIPQVI